MCTIFIDKEKVWDIFEASETSVTLVRKFAAALASLDWISSTLSPFSVTSNCPAAAKSAAASKLEIKLRI
jgi:hypothetical protein